MTPERTAPTLAGLLQAVQYAAMAIPAHLELGTAKTLSPRDPDRLGKPLIERAFPCADRSTRTLVLRDVHNPARDWRAGEKARGTRLAAPLPTA